MEENIKIYAVDFDGTLCSAQWPDIGEPNQNLIDFLIEEQRNGAKVILWTCRIDEKLDDAVNWCRFHGLIFDAVNDNIPENIEKYGNNARKVFATHYIDDLAIDKSIFNIPFKGGTK